MILCRKNYFKVDSSYWQKYWKLDEDAIQVLFNEMSDNQLQIYLGEPKVDFEWFSDDEEWLLFNKCY